MGSRTVHPKQHLNLFSHFCTVKQSWAAWQTDWQTDTGIINNNSLNLMHSMQLKDTDIKVDVTILSFYYMTVITYYRTVCVHKWWRTDDKFVKNKFKAHVQLAQCLASKQWWRWTQPGSWTRLGVMTFLCVKPSRITSAVPASVYIKLYIYNYKNSHRLHVICLHLNVKPTTIFVKYSYNTKSS